MVGMLFAGCKKAPVKVPETPEEQATMIMEEAKRLFAEADTLVDLDGVEAKAEEAKAIAEIDGIKQLMDQIQEKRAEITAAVRQKKLDDFLATARAKAREEDWRGVIAAADEALAIDPDNAEATSLKKRAQDALRPAEAPGEREYKDLNAEIERQIRARQYTQAIASIRRQAQHKGPGRPSRENEISGLEAKQLISEGQALERRRDLRGAIAKYREAERKDPRSPARSLRVAAERKLRDQQTADVKKRAYRDAMRRGAQQDRSKNYAAALREYETALRNFTTSSERSAATRARDRVRQEQAFDTARAAGTRAMGRKDYAAAVLNYKKALGMKRDPAVERKLLEAEGLQAEKEGDAATEAVNLALAVEKYDLAYSKNPTPELAKKRDGAKAKKEDVDYKATIASCEAMREAKNFRAAARILAELVKRYPDRPEAGELLEKGATRDEQKDIDAKARTDYTALQKTVKKLTTGTQKIAAYQAAMPSFNASPKYSKLVTNLIKRERDTMLKGRYSKLTGEVKKRKTSAEKIALLTQALPEYKDSSYEKRIEDQIKRERDTQYRSQFNTLKTEVGKKKKPEEKIALLEAELPRYKDTSFADQIEKMLEKERDSKMRPVYTKLTADAKKLKKADEKLGLLVPALPSFEGTSYKARVEKMIEKERDNKARPAYTTLTGDVKKLKTPAAKLQLLESQKGSFEGTSYLKKIDSMIEREKTALVAAKYKSLSTRVRSLKTPAAKIAEYKRMLPEFKGTRYEKTVQSRIDSEESRLVAGRYKNLTAELKNLKAQPKIARLQAAQAYFKGTRYEKTVESMLKREKDNLKRNMYSDLTKEVNKKKTSAEKIALLKADMSQYIGTSFYDKIKSQIKSLESRLASDAKAARDKAARTAYDDVMAKIKKTPKDYDANIAALQGAKAQVAGSTYEKKIDSQIKKQQDLKKKAAPK